MNQKKALLGITCSIVGVLGVLFLFDVVSFVEDLYFKQNRSLVDFLPGGGFILAFCFLLFIGVVLQIILFRFLYPLKNLFKALITVVIAVLIVLITYIFSQPLDTGIFFSIGFLVYTMLNFFTNKKLSSIIKAGNKAQGVNLPDDFQTR
jgi:hypothetical protein